MMLSMMPFGLTILNITLPCIMSLGVTKLKMTMSITTVNIMT